MMGLEHTTAPVDDSPPGDLPAFIESDIWLSLREILSLLESISFVVTLEAEGMRRKKKQISLADDFQVREKATLRDFEKRVTDVIVILSAVTVSFTLQNPG